MFICPGIPKTFPASLDGGDGSGNARSLFFIDNFNPRTHKACSVTNLYKKLRIKSKSKKLNRISYRRTMQVIQTHRFSSSSFTVYVLVWSFMPGAVFVTTQLGGGRTRAYTDVIWADKIKKT